MASGRITTERPPGRPSGSDGGGEVVGVFAWSTGEATGSLVRAGLETITRFGGELVPMIPRNRKPRRRHAACRHASVRKSAYR